MRVWLASALTLITVSLATITAAPQAETTQAKMTNGDVILTDSTIQSYAAAQLLAIEGSQLSVPGLVPDQYYPVLALNMNFVRAATESMAGQIEMLFYLCHESVHYRQVLDYPGGADGWADLFERPMSFEDCSVNWFEEEEAYLVQCLAGYELDSSESVPAFCRVMPDRKAFEQALFYVRVYAEQEAFPECPYAWAVSAGHPNPDSFK